METKYPVGAPVVTRSVHDPHSSTPDLGVLDVRTSGNVHVAHILLEMEGQPLLTQEV